MFAIERVFATIGVFVFMALTIVMAVVVSIFHVLYTSSIVVCHL